jgi:hypothetical protein
MSSEELDFDEEVASDEESQSAQRMSRKSMEDFQDELLQLERQQTLRELEDDEEIGIDIDIDDDMLQHKSSILKRMQWLSDRLLTVSSSWEPIVLALLDNRRKDMTNTMARLQRDIDTVMEEKRAVTFETTAYHSIIKRCEDQEAMIIGSIEQPKKTQLRLLRRLRKFVGKRLDNALDIFETSARDLQIIQEIQTHLEMFMSAKEKLEFYQSSAARSESSTPSFSMDESSNLLQEVKRKQYLAEEKSFLDRKTESARMLDAHLNTIINGGKDCISLQTEKLNTSLEELDEINHLCKEMKNRLLQFKRDLRPPQNGRMVPEEMEVCLQHELNELNRYHGKLKSIEIRRTTVKVEFEQFTTQSEFEKVIEQYIENSGFERSIRNSHVISSLFSSEETHQHAKKPMFSKLAKAALEKSKEELSTSFVLDDLNSGPSTISLAAYRSVFELFCKEKHVSEWPAPDDRKPLRRLLFVIESVLEEFGKGNISRGITYRRAYEKATKNRPETCMTSDSKPSPYLNTEDIGILNVLLISCTNLLNADEDIGSLSDPYVTLQLGVNGPVQKSRRVNNDCNPVYMQLFKLSWYQVTHISWYQVLFFNHRDT